MNNTPLTNSVGANAMNGLDNLRDSLIRLDKFEKAGLDVAPNVVMRSRGKYIPLSFEVQLVNGTPVLMATAAKNAEDAAGASTKKEATAATNKRK